MVDGHDHPAHGLKELKMVQISVKDALDVPQVACRQIKAQYTVLGHGHMTVKVQSLDARSAATETVCVISAL
jgi:hypothetical protein